MMTNQDMVLTATIYRVSELEKKLTDIMAKIDTTNATIIGQINQIKSCMVLKHSVPNEESGIANIVVPEELSFAKGKKFKRGSKFMRATTNKNSEIVSRRWALWKSQYEAGIPASVIARAWGCDHTTILSARNKNWINHKPKRLQK